MRGQKLEDYLAMNYDNVRREQDSYIREVSADLIGDRDVAKDAYETSMQNANECLKLLKGGGIVSRVMAVFGAGDKSIKTRMAKVESLLCSLEGEADKVKAVYEDTSQKYQHLVKRSALAGLEQQRCEQEVEQIGADIEEAENYLQTEEDPINRIMTEDYLISKREDMETTNIGAAEHATRVLAYSEIARTAKSIRDVSRTLSHKVMEYVSKARLASQRHNSAVDFLALGGDVYERMAELDSCMEGLDNLSFEALSLNMAAAEDASRANTSLGMSSSRNSHMERVAARANANTEKNILYLTDRAKRIAGNGSAGKDTSRAETSL